MIFNDFVRNINKQHEELSRLENIVYDFNEILKQDQ